MHVLSDTLCLHEGQGGSNQPRPHRAPGFGAGALTNASSS